jgi:hypothetical protein
VLQLKNLTPFAGTIALLTDRDGLETLIAIIKGTFVLGPPAAVAEEQLPVVAAPEHYGDPASTSMRVASDISLPKPSTDVLLIGHAHAPGGRPTYQMDVRVRVGPVQQVARITGPRAWRWTGAGYAASTPDTFGMMPLVWERAFGGTRAGAAGDVAEPRNPVGTGFHPSDSPLSADGLSLPNVEPLDEPVTSLSQAPTPVGFGPVGAHWMPRVHYAGTYDAAWEAQRAPYLPTDFDDRFLQVAPTSLVAPGYLQGGEPVELIGLSPAGDIRWTLPFAQLRVTYVLDDSPIERPAHLDTVLLEPDAGRCSLVWRASFSCNKKALRIGEVRAELLRLA